MNVNGDTIPLYGLGIVILLLLLILSAIYLLVGYWQRRIPQSLKKFPPDFHQLQVENKKVLAITRKFSAEDPPPYGALMIDINHQLDEVANRLVELKNHYVSVQDLIHQITFPSWKFLIGAPFTFLTWYSLTREVDLISQEVDKIKFDFGLIQEKINELEKQAWLVSIRARQAIEGEKTIRRLMEYLGNERLRGDTVELAGVQEEQVIEGLEKIPGYFFTGDESNVSKQATKADVCTVYELLDEIEPSLDALSTQLISWENRYKTLEEKVNKASTQMERVEQFLDGPPPFVEISDEKGRLEIIKITLMVMTDTLHRLEVESFDVFEQELDQQQNALVELGDRLRKGFRQNSRLKSLLDDLAHYQRECSADITSLGKNQQYPILWDISQSQFMSINKAVSELGSPYKDRTLEEIETELAMADKLSLQMMRLKAHLIAVSSQHTYLLSLMVSEEKQRGAEWVEEYKQLGSEIAEFHPDNWQRSHAVAGYLTDVLTLQSRHNTILLRDPKTAIPESQLDDIIMKCESIIQDHQQLKLRSEKIQARLQWIKSTDASTREQYQTLRSAINQISWLVNSNSFLKQFAEPELSKIRKDIERYGSELNQTQSGMIEKKSMAVNIFQDDLLAAGNRWLERLNQDVSSRSGSLADSIDKIHKIASLDDPAIIKAQRLLAREERRVSQIQLNTAPIVQLDVLVSEIRGRSSVWQEFVAVQQELEEIVAAPLQDAVSHAEKQRNLALAALSEASQKISEQRAWPACSVSLSEERVKTDELETRWVSLKSKPTRAIWVVRQYGELAAGYQEVFGKVTRARQWAAQEQKRIMDLESEIDRLNNYWRRQEQLINQDPIAVEQVRRMRLHSSEEVSRIKQSWISGSSDINTYDDVLQALLENARSLRSAVVTMKTGGGEPQEIRLERERRLE